jgi:inner membrane protein
VNIAPSADARSLGLKLILVGALAFLLWIPAMLVYALVWDRSTRADEVTREIVDRAGGRQTISGPIILVPATVDTGRVTKEGEPIFRSTAVAFTPKELAVAAEARTSKRRRSIYEASVYDADLVMRGRFDALTPPSAEGPVTLRWDEAAIAIKFGAHSHLKGVRDTIQLKLDGLEVGADFEPGIEIAGEEGQRYRAAGVSARLTAANIDRGVAFEARLPLSGGGALYFSPVGEETIVSLSADWPDPGFQGAYLPDDRDIRDDGFTAEWRIPYLARSIPRSFFADANLSVLDGHAYDHGNPGATSGKTFGVEFVAATSPYKSVNRALKYALMFLGIVFLTFFLFEATLGGRAHAAQYILLGATQVVFYLLVLAFSEHIGFGAAFVITAGATVVLSGYYAATVFHSKIRGLIAFAAFSASYGLIYLLMKSEDYALLIGSVTAFGALALTMIVTRNLDWYGARKPLTTTSQERP